MAIKTRQLDEYRFEVAREGGMRVPGLVYASERMMREIRNDHSLSQVANVAHLPGIVSRSIAMPDIHWGYGFPIGGVAAFDEDEGVLSPGGVGYDINCGVRLLSSHIAHADVADHIEDMSLALHRAIPSGVGSRSPRRLSKKELERVMVQGAAWSVGAGFGRADDLEVIEESGQLAGARPDLVSERAVERGRPQLGSLGSGNHFCELGYVAEIYDEAAAAAYGLALDRITLMIHSGSRGLGYQICDESLRDMLRAAAKYDVRLPDRQLSAAPLSSPEAERYFGQMACAINYAFANRQMMTQFARAALTSFLAGRGDAGGPEGYGGGGHLPDDRSLGLDLVYDVCHNIAKWEHHEVDGERRRVCVHRKGATRAFGPGHPQVPERYRAVGQPVLVPGDMGRYSFVLAGTERAMRETFGSSCHGAGRRLSRKAAKKAARGRAIFRELRAQGVFVRSDSKQTVAEEMPEAYKDVAEVIEVMHGAGIARKVAKLVPLAVVKG